MLARNQAEALQLIKGELNGLGYVGGLIQEDYDFAEVLLENVEVSQILLNQSQGEMRRWCGGRTALLNHSPGTD